MVSLLDVILPLGVHAFAHGDECPRLAFLSAVTAIWKGLSHAATSTCTKKLRIMALLLGTWQLRNTSILQKIGGFGANCPPATPPPPLASTTTAIAD